MRVSGTRSTWEPPSTSRPISRSRTFTTAMRDARAPVSTSPRLSFRLRATTGMMRPRRLMTPFIKPARRVDARRARAGFHPAQVELPLEVDHRDDAAAQVDDALDEAGRARHRRDLGDADDLLHPR